MGSAIFEKHLYRRRAYHYPCFSSFFLTGVRPQQLQLGQPAETSKGALGMEATRSEIEGAGPYLPEASHKPALAHLISDICVREKWTSIFFKPLHLRFLKSLLNHTREKRCEAVEWHLFRVTMICLMSGTSFTWHYWEVALKTKTQTTQSQKLHGSTDPHDHREEKTLRLQAVRPSVSPWEGSEASLDVST